MAFRCWLLAVVLGVSFAAQGAAADPVEIRAAAHEGYGRIAFDWPAPVEYSAAVAGNRLTIHFSRPLDASPALLKSALGSLLADAEIAGGGNDLVAHLKRPVTASAFTVRERTVVVDLTPVVEHKSAAPKPATAKAAPPKRVAAKATPKPAEATATPKPAEAKTTPKVAEAKATPKVAETKPAVAAKPAAKVRIKTAERNHVTHVTFVWPHHVAAEFSEKGGIARLVFHAVGAIDAAVLGKALPALSPSVVEDRDTTTVAMSVPAGLRLQHFARANWVTLALSGTAKPAPVAPRPAPAVAKALTETLASVVAPAAANLSDDANGSDDANSADGAPPPPAALPPPAAAAQPPSLLKVRFTTDDGPSLAFDWPAPISAAVFRRGAAVWVVFGAATKLDLADPLGRGQPAFDAIAQVPAKDATVLRIVPHDGRKPSLRRSGATWMIDFKIEGAQPDTPIAVDIRSVSGSAAAVFRVQGATAPVRIADPERGDTLLVVPVGPIGRGVSAPPQLVEFAALPSLQGIVLRPHADDLAVTVSDDAVTATRPGGLMVSSARDRLLGRKPARAHALFDFQDWRGAKDADFSARRNALERAVADAPAGARSAPRLALARFYFANLFAAETLAVLDALGRDDAAVANDPAVHALKGAACLLADDRKCAAAELGQKSLAGEPEAALWRGSLAAGAGDWDAAAQGFLASVGLLPTYPKKLRTRFALEAAQAVLETGRENLMQPLLDLVPQDPSDPGAQAMMLYLEGRRALRDKRLDDALGLWDKAAALNDRPSRARALYDRALALLDAGRATRPETIKKLDALRFIWRGDAFEYGLLRKLGELKLADGDAAGGLEAMQQAAAYFPDYPGAKDVAKATADGFAALFLGPQSDDLPPFKALVLYDQFHDVEPVGERRDKIIAKLIDRLVAVDLLDRAAGLLDEQVKTRLTGAEKARGATQLALLRLMDHKPDAALQALDIDVGTDVPADLATQRQQLRARTLLELDRPKDALALILSDQSRDADRLRADIYWRTQDWADAAQALFRIAGTPIKGEKLDPDTVRIVIGLAAALTLADDQAGLAKLRATFGEAMHNSDGAASFDVLAGTGDTAAGDIATLASKVAQIGELQSFLKTYRQKLASNKPAATN